MEKAEGGAKTVLTSELFCLLEFFVYTFIYMSSQTWIDQRFPADTASDVVLVLHYVRSIFLIAGFLTVPVLARKSGLTGSRKLHIAAAVLFAVCIIAMIPVSSLPLYVTLMLMSTYICGFAGSLVYGAISKRAEADGSVRIGIVVGAGGAVSVLLQWLLQILTDIGAVMPVLLSVMFFMLIFLERFRDASAVAEAGSAEDVRTSSADIRKRLIALVVATAAVIALFPFYEVYLTSLSFISLLYGWPRLLLAVGYLITGAADSTKKENVTSLLILCLSLLSVVFMLLMQDAEVSSLPTALFYLLLGSVIAWFSITFMRIAPGTGNPWLWAPMGRVLDAGVTIILSFIGMSVSFTPLTAAIMNLVLLAVIIVSMVSGGFLLPAQPQNESAGTGTAEMPEPAPAVRVLTDEERLAVFSDHYSLTDRERDVLGLVVNSEDKASILAERLEISRSLFQRYITQIYEKTGTKTRMGLAKLYFSYSEQDGTDGQQ